VVIPLHVPAHLEDQFRQSAARGDTEAMRRLLSEAIDLNIGAILHEGKDETLTPEEFERLADELADGIAEERGPQAHPLSDHAVGREGLYENHL
jgi:hypothetical protein